MLRPLDKGKTQPAVAADGVECNWSSEWAVGHRPLCMTARVCFNSTGTLQVAGWAPATLVTQNVCVDVGIDVRLATLA